LSGDDQLSDKRVLFGCGTMDKKGYQRAALKKNITAQPSLQTAVRWNFSREDNLTAWLNW
jgi:hypothetical protein